MPNDLIKNLAPVERVFLLIVLGSNGVVWVCVALAIGWIFDLQIKLIGLFLIWATTTAFGLWVLGRLHEINKGEDE